MPFKIVWHRRKTQGQRRHVDHSSPYLGQWIIQLDTVPDELHPGLRLPPLADEVDLELVRVVEHGGQASGMACAADS